MIETERLLLRQPLASDLAWQLAELNTPAVMRHLGGVRDAAAVANSLERDMAALCEGGLGFWTVALRANGEPVGRCGLAPVWEELAPLPLRSGIQAGWSFAEAHWGQGLAGEAAQAVIGHGFAVRGLNEIWAQTSASNQGSTRMMARLGFNRRADLDYADPDYPAADNPTTVYHLARTDWMQSR